MDSDSKDSWSLFKDHVFVASLPLNDILSQPRCKQYLINWPYYSDVLNALFLVLSSPLNFSMMCQYHLYTLQPAYDFDSEEIWRARQVLEVFLFLFTYQATHLSGVTTCTTIDMMSKKDTYIIGYDLLHFHVLVTPVNV